MNKNIDYKYLNYIFKTKASGSINFIRYKGQFSLFTNIRDGEISLEMAEEDQNKLKGNLIKQNQEIHIIKLIYSYIQ